ncbi:hypothetical protein [Flavobacterium subsaxonicum]|uniref:Uncharacterized protein n=1 Tax=Flavobacterium subsaxonicum WB 4.1-42 = DSM 21790 TaxID=1121898 RepID=A0A0A2MXA6_9FLAO|nr:hypothetical protein [Flavobacterium subsaxonicum]KGO92855.1 hypothetical protein Q766_09465 [Flavobacterium subsaxonicum WB 4.1-42 = DSM 21790]
MKNITLTLFLLYAVVGFAQSNDNSYSIYSTVLNNKLAQFYGPKLDSLQSLIVLYNNNTDSNDLKFVDELVDDPPCDYLFNYLYFQSGKDSVFIHRFKNEPEIKEVITKFRKNANINFDADMGLLKLISNAKINTITLQEYRSFFKNGKNIDKGWNKIKDKYGSKSVFELSQITYSQNFAVFYIAHHCGGLCGSGDFVIMENVEGKWRLLSVINLWIS